MRRLLIIIVILIAIPLLGASCINVKSSKTTDGGVFKSDDSGENWTQKVFIRQEKKNTVSINNESITSFTFDPENKDIIYLGTRDNGIYRTEDGGEVWKLFKGGGEYSGISIDPETPQMIYLSTGATIYKTPDQGENWDNIYIDPNGKKIVSVLVDSYDSSRILALTGKGDLLVSTDWGDTWKVLYRLEQDTEKLFINPKDTRVMYATTSKKGILKSTDGGQTWNDILTAFEGTPEKAQVYTLKMFYFTEEDPDILYIVTKRGIYRSRDAGFNWENINTLQPAASVDISAFTVNPENHNEIWFAIGKIIHWTTNNGANWKTIETFPSTRTINYLVVHPDNPKLLWAGTYIAPKK